MSRSFNWFLALALTVAMVSLEACSSEVLTGVDEASGAYSGNVGGSGKGGADVQVVDVVYQAELCPDQAVPGTTENTSLTDTDHWLWYKINVTAGETITVEVDPADDLDVIVWLAPGTSTTTSGLSYNLGGKVPAGMSKKAVADAGGCGGTETISHVAQTTGVYTILVFKTGFADCLNGSSFTISASGINEGDNCATDSDGDGINDDEDPYPSSITIETVLVGYGTPNECDPGIDNIEVETGVFMMDHIQGCLDGNNTKNGRKACLKALADAWVAAGLITQNQKAGILACAY